MTAAAADNVLAPQEDAVCHLTLPAKIMSLLQHMSARMRQMQKAYVDTCHELEVYGDKARLTAEHGEWTDSHNRTYNLLKAMFPSMYHEEEK